MTALWLALTLSAAATPADAPRAARPAPARAAAAAAPAAQAAAPAPARSAPMTGRSVVGTRHNLSASGSGKFRAASETEVCKFCHVSHMGSAGAGNRPSAPAAGYQRYASSTMRSLPAGAPSAASRTCLSCHDGTIALGETLTSGRIAMATADRLSPADASHVSTDLRRSHPVAVRPGVSTRLRRPLADEPVKLQNELTVECTSCHDPHVEDKDPGRRKFLVTGSRDSALCLSCHELQYWRTNPSAHRSSTRRVGAAEGLPEGYGTVGENGCLSCHKIHDASQRGWLLRTSDTASDDDVCLRCHAGTVAAQDIRRELLKPSNHAAPGGGPSAHDAGEGPTNAAHRLPELTPGRPRHATCVDCHEPHAAFSQPAKAPFAPGALSGVWGIDRNGQRVDSVRYEYEVCFKCHGDSANQPQARGAQGAEILRRAVTEVNLRRVFDPASPSFHPVAAPGKNGDVPSLIAPLTTSSIIYCGDCHASDQAASGAPRGPHGSTFAHLLERNYTTLDRTVESAGAYALCYKCHDRDVLLSDRSSFNLHRRHVVDGTAPCSACHNSHGVSSSKGTPTNNAHLIDFDVSIAKPASGALAYTSTGFRSGSCTLSCHGKEHVDEKYSSSSSALSRALRAASGVHAARPAPARGAPRAQHPASPAPGR